MFRDYELEALAVLGLSYQSFPFTEKERDDYKTSVKRGYRKAASLSHPDRGGTADSFRRVRDAYDVLCKAMQPGRATTAPTPSTRSGRHWCVLAVTSPNMGSRASLVREAFQNQTFVTPIVEAATSFEKGQCLWFHDVSRYHRCHNNAVYAIYKQNSVTSFCREHMVDRDALVIEVKLQVEKGKRDREAYLRHKRDLEVDRRLRQVYGRSQSRYSRY